MIACKIQRFAGILLAVFLVACGGDEGDQATGGRSGRGGRGRNAAAAPVKAEPVKREAISQYILKNTTLEAEQWVDVRTRATGQVVSILVE